jgi:hypothetical protein
MQKKPKTTRAKAAIYTMLTLGVVLTIASAFYTSSFLAILGVSIIFGGQHSFT